MRKQAKMTLKCMQALLRVQARLRDQQARLQSHDVDDGGRKSMFAECNNLWESRYLGEIRERKSMVPYISFILTYIHIYIYMTKRKINFPFPTVNQE